MEQADPSTECLISTCSGQESAKSGPRPKLGVVQHPVQWARSHARSVRYCLCCFCATKAVAHFEASQVKPVTPPASRVQIPPLEPHRKTRPSSIPSRPMASRVQSCNHPRCLCCQGYGSTGQSAQCWHLVSCLFLSGFTQARACGNPAEARRTRRTRGRWQN